MTITGLNGRVAVVTGAAGGLGRAAAVRLADEGVHIVAVDLDEAAAREVASALSTESIGVGADVTTESGVDSYLAAALDRFDAVDFHFLNAGIAGSTAPLVDVSVDEWDAVMAVNLRGPFLGVRGAFREFHKTGGHGAIVVTSSIAGLRGSNDLLAYTTSKHGVIGLVHGAAVYGGPIGVRVNGIAPGIVPTQIFGPAGRDDMIRRAGPHRCDGRDVRRRSPVRWRTCSATTPPTSPARSSRSTGAPTSRTPIATRAVRDCGMSPSPISTCCTGTVQRRPTDSSETKGAPRQQIMARGAPCVVATT